MRLVILFDNNVPFWLAMAGGWISVKWAILECWAFIHTASCQNGVDWGEAMGDGCPRWWVRGRRETVCRRWQVRQKRRPLEGSRLQTLQYTERQIRRCERRQQWWSNNGCDCDSGCWDNGSGGNRAVAQRTIAEALVATTGPSSRNGPRSATGTGPRNQVIRPELGTWEIH